MTTRSVVRTVVIGLVVVACGEPRVSQRGSALDAYCEATVTGVGTLAVETDYLPRVVNCENGAASAAALEAQAIAARSYLYYRLDRSGQIGDGQSDQVYSCGREPEPQHIAAVEATRGVILRYRDTQVAAFYVAGALQTGPSCTGGADDPTDTEHYVTYNEGRRGQAVEQTTLGFVDPDNRANRGCMSQNGSDCLSDAGWDASEILRFFYGEDIEIARASGPCVGEPPAIEPDADAPDVAAPGGCSAGGGPGGAGVALLVVAALARRRR